MSVSILSTYSVRRWARVASTVSPRVTGPKMSSSASRRRRLLPTAGFWAMLCNTLKTAAAALGMYLVRFFRRSFCSRAACWRVIFTFSCNSSTLFVSHVKAGNVKQDNALQVANCEHCSGLTFELDCSKGESCSDCNAGFC